MTEKNITSKFQSSMNLGGWQKISLMDYPDKIATVVFTNGCVFQCQFCYNKDLVMPPFKNKVSNELFFEFLKERQGKVQAVVITGGEPTMHQSLIPFMEEIKKLGYLIKLDSCGYIPKSLKDCLESGLVDYVAMDIKAPLDRYAEIVGIPVQTDRIVESIKLIQESGIDYEFRSTLIDGVHELEDVLEMVKLIRGSEKYFLQHFKPTDTVINKNYQSKKAPPEDTFMTMRQICEQYVDTCKVR